MELSTRITNISDVEQFANYLVNKEHVNLHPDDDFKSYICAETNEPAYSDAEAEKRNQLMEQCFDVCEREGVDIYEVMGKYVAEKMGIEVFY
jgi:hypothetical protein